MKVRDVANLVESLAPMGDACSWDNPGLMCGDYEAEVKKIFIALDATDEVIDQAEAFGADLLLTHHPIIFHPLSHVTADDPVGRRILRMLNLDMSNYAAHTNFDIHGMGALVAGALALADTRPLLEDGMGQVGLLENPMTLREFGEFVKRALMIDSVRIYGDPDQMVQTVATLPGSGGGEIGDAIAAGADVYLTGDVSHHQAIDGVMEGICIVDAGHYGTEHIFTSFMETLLKNAMPMVAVKPAEHKEPFLVV